MKLAKEYQLKSIAFPSISTGAYGYPKKDAGKIALKAVMEFLNEENYLEKIYFVLFNHKDYELYEKLLDKTVGGNK